MLVAILLARPTGGEFRARFNVAGHLNLKQILDA
jgi:hypothetical protein